jgi:hypothetical protein
MERIRIRVLVVMRRLGGPKTISRQGALRYASQRPHWMIPLGIASEREYRLKILFIWPTNGF